MGDQRYRTDRVRYTTPNVALGGVSGILDLLGFASPSWFSARLSAPFGLRIKGDVARYGVEDERSGSGEPSD